RESCTSFPMIRSGARTRMGITSRSPNTYARAVEAVTRGLEEVPSTERRGHFFCAEVATMCGASDVWRRCVRRKMRYRKPVLLSDGDIRAQIDAGRISLDPY